MDLNNEYLTNDDNDREMYFNVELSDIKITYMDPEFDKKYVDILINFDNYKKVIIRSNENNDREYMFYEKKIKIDYETKFGNNLDQKNLIISIINDENKIANGFIDLLTIANGKIFQKLPLIKVGGNEIYCFVEFNITMQNYSEIEIHIKNLKIISEQDNKFHNFFIEIGFSGEMISDRYKTKQNNSISEWNWDDEDIFIVVRCSLFELLGKYIYLNIYRKGLINKKMITIKIPIVNNQKNDKIFYHFNQKILLPEYKNGIINGYYYFTNLSRYIQFF